MAERTGGIRAPLSSARVYSAFAGLVNGPGGKRRFVDDYLRPKPGDAMLDIGCGPAAILESIPEGVRYVGIDVSPTYVDAARRRFGDRGEFRCTDVRDADLPARSFDLVLAMGVLHHLDDEGARALLRLAARVLRDEGRAVTVDGAFVSDQSRLARWIVSRDRGASIRSPSSYAALAEPFFATVEQTIHHDLLRIPYTHSIMQCSAPRREVPGG